MTRGYNFALTALMVVLAVAAVRPSSGAEGMFGSAASQRRLLQTGTSSPPPTPSSPGLETTAAAVAANFANGFGKPGQFTPATPAATTPPKTCKGKIIAAFGAASVCYTIDPLCVSVDFDLFGNQKCCCPPTTPAMTNKPPTSSPPPPKTPQSSPPPPPSPTPPPVTPASIQVTFFQGCQNDADLPSKTYTVSCCSCTPLDLGGISSFSYSSSQPPNYVTVYTGQSCTGDSTTGNPNGNNRCMAAAGQQGYNFLDANSLSTPFNDNVVSAQLNGCVCP